jgi:hypothetical protein
MDAATGTPCINRDEPSGWRAAVLPAVAFLKLKTNIDWKHILN